MNYPKYDFTENTQTTIFEFYSIGKYGVIEKIIKFTLTENEEVYNLGFGNKINIKGKDFSIDDSVISDNGDRDKVLATIAEAVYIFTEIHPDTYVYFTGNSESRNRLYRMAISNNFEELSMDFTIFGIVRNQVWSKTEAVPFNKAENFIGFLIKKK